MEMKAKIDHVLTGPTHIYKSLIFDRKKITKSMWQHIIYTQTG